MEEEHEVVDSDESTWDVDAQVARLRVSAGAALDPHLSVATTPIHEIGEMMVRLIYWKTAKP
jgi:hypothetical protein